MFFQLLWAHLPFVRRAVTIDNMNPDGPRNKNPQGVVYGGELSLESFRRNILYEDNHLLAVYKPAGMLTQGDSSGRRSILDLGKHWLQVTYHKPGRAFLGLIHRLDLPVSGIVVFAKTSKAARRLSEQFRQRTTQKIYLAVVHGTPNPPLSTSVMGLRRIGGKSLTSSLSTPGARRAELSYDTLATVKEFSLLRVFLATGRRHQIRAQLAALGHPIIGDRAYGSPVKMKGPAIALQAHSLSFIHPVRNEEIRLEAPIPKGFPWSEFPRNPSRRHPALTPPPIAS